MIAVTIAGQAAWLCPYSHNVDAVASLKAAVRLDTQRALTGPTSARPQHLALRLAYTWPGTMRAAEYAALLGATQAAQDEPVVVPLWPFAVAAGAALAVASGLTVAWTRGWTVWAVNPGSYGAYDFKAPLLYGRFTQPPRFAGKNGDDVGVEFAFEEDGPLAYALVPPAATDATYATASGYAAAIFPFRHEGSTLPAPGAAVVEVDRSALGAGREKTTTYYPQIRERVEQQSFKFAGAAAAAQLLGWWARRAGGAEAHWVTTSQRIGMLAADTAAGANPVTLAAAPLVGINTDLALLAPGAAPELRRIASLAGAVATLDRGIVGSYVARSTLVTLAMLARHTDDTLELKWRRAGADWIAQATLHWREAAPEYTPGAGEARGVTLGRLPPRWWGLQLDLDYAGAVVSTRLTNWESGSSAVGGYAWAYNDFAVPKVARSIDLEDDGTTLDAAWFDALANWLPGQLAARGWLTVWVADVAGDGTIGAPAVWWQGEVDGVAPKGVPTKIKVVGGNAIFAQKYPRQIDGVNCYKNLFSARCGLLESDWTWSAALLAVSGNTATVGTLVHTNGLANPAGWGFADWFALGYLQWTDIASGTPRRIKIRSHLALAGGTLALIFDRTCPLGVGDSVLLVPACDKQGSTCRAYDAVTNYTGRFGNYARFGGFEDKPAIDPGFVIPNQNQQAKK